MVYIIYHANCPDGFGAAYAAWVEFGDSAKYIPCSHGDEFPDIPSGSEVYICDFSFKRDILLDKSKDLDITVIDHHHTAQEDLKGLDFAHFDMTKSGAVLTWEYFHDKSVPKLLLHIQDRDIWKWSIPGSDEILTALDCYPQEFEIWDDLMYKLPRLKDEGEVIVKFRDKLVESSVSNAYPAKLLGYDGMFVCLGDPGLISLVGNHLCKYNDIFFAGAYSITSDDGVLTQNWSLRSIGDNDCSVIAKHFGGGGHKNACGFKIQGKKNFII